MEGRFYQFAKIQSAFHVFSLETLVWWLRVKDGQADEPGFKSCAVTSELGGRGTILNLSEPPFLRLENGGGGTEVTPTIRSPRRVLLF